MSIPMPSQYDCDNMKPGDIMFVRKRGFIYKALRRLSNNKIILKVRKDWSPNPTYIYYYQEDCTLIFDYEVKCTQKLDNKIPCVICFGKKLKPFATVVLETVEVSLYNLQLKFKNGITLMLPIEELHNSIKKNIDLFKQIEDKRKIEQNIKFLRYKGSYYKKYVEDNNIKSWNAQYCGLCGKPVEFIFKEDVVEVISHCECNNLSINFTSMTYDQLALWCAGQVEGTRKYYSKFWFK